MKLRKLEGWQKRKLMSAFFTIVIIASVYITSASMSLLKDKNGEAEYWTSNLVMNEELQSQVDAVSTNATKVYSGTYVENLKEVNIKGSYFRGVYQIWFRWVGNPELDMAHHFDIYKGSVNSMELIKETHVGDVNYQLIRIDATVTKNYWTKRFPLESHQLRMYLKSNYTADKVVFMKDEGSGVNGNIGISGYELKQMDTGVYANKYDSIHGDPQAENGLIVSEMVTAIELNRDGWGLYVKCFIALVGTISWVMIALFICSYHHVDPLGMMPAALFGTVTNIMVGANLLPDALEIGLLEYINFYGILTILACALAVINVNRIRNKWNDKEFASYFGRVLFYTMLFFILLGNIIMPLSAYMG